MLFNMRKVLISALLSFAVLSCTGQSGTEQLRLPIIRYNPVTYLSAVEDALSDPASGRYALADSAQLADVDEEIIAYLSGQDAFIISFAENDAKCAPKFIGIKDKERGYLKYLNVEKEQYRYSLDAVIGDIYGSLEEYISTWPEDQRELFYDDPQGLYTFPIELYAVNVIGYGNSVNPDNPVRFKAAVSFLRSSRPEWNDDTWANDSAEIVKHSESVTGAFLHFDTGKAKFENDDPNHFPEWVNERLTYPDSALECAATGRVTTQFTIDMFGNIEDVKVLRGVHPALDSVALKIVASSSSKWSPAADIVGNTCSIKYTFPVIFTREMMFKAFIVKMYNENLYEDYGFLMKHCSPELLKKLQDAYPYDSDEPAYATWLFRSGQQDSKPGSDEKTVIVDVKADGDWYVYTALDMGWEFSNRIRLSCKNGKIIIEDIDKV